MIQRTAPTSASTRATPRRSIALPLLASLVLTWSATTAAAAPAPAANRSVVVRVVDQFGAALDPASVMACPYEGEATCNSAHLVVGSTNSTGFATLRLAAGERYDIAAFVRNPSPPWACPGTMFNGAEYHFSTVGNLVQVAPSAIGPLHTFVVRRPSPSDCVPVHVVDDAGNPLPTARLFVCPLAADGTPCPGGQTFEQPDHDGVIRMPVDPAVTYRLGAFLSNSGWPCPAYVSPDGNSFHFSPSATIGGSDLVSDGLTLVIRKPSASECVVVHVVDDLGNELTTAGLFVCPLAADGTPCPGGTSFEGPDPDGVIRMPVDPTVTYRLGAFLANPGWPCPPYIHTDGTPFFFSPNVDILGADLITDGLTLVIHHPSASECPVDNATVRVMDDVGNELTTAGLFVCALDPDGTPCPDGITYEQADADGLIHLNVEPTVTYRLGAFVVDPGWPCPGWKSGDGKDFYFSPNTDILGADLIADGLTLVIHRPTADECPADNATVRVEDHLGNLLPTAGLFVCPLTADGTPCPGGNTFDHADADGLIHLKADPTITYRLGGFVTDTGWPCEEELGWTSGDGHYFFFSPNTDILGADLVADGLTLVIHRPAPSDCSP